MKYTVYLNLRIEAANITMKVLDLLLLVVFSPVERAVVTPKRNLACRLETTQVTKHV